MPSRLDQYLDEVSQPLPESQRTEWRLEAREHLLALIDAYLEVGHDHEAATDLAFAKFGEAAVLAEQMREEAVKSVPLPITLKFVASLWLWGGLKPLLVFALTDRHPLYLLWGTLSFLVAAGLIRRHPMARSVAMSWSAVVAASIVPSLYYLFTSNLARAPSSSVSHYLDGVALACGIGVLQLWILTRPQVKDLFKPFRFRSPIRLWY